MCASVLSFAEAERAEVGRFAKNFLPILFNVYSQESSASESPVHRRSVLDTIRAYLTITQSEVSGAYEQNLAVRSSPLSGILGWSGEIPGAEYVLEIGWCR